MKLKLLQLPLLLTLLFPCLAYSQDLSASAKSIKKIVMMLNIVSKEYHEGIKDGQVVNDTEYGESLVFIDQAYDKYQSIAHATTNQETASKLNELFMQLTRLAKDKKDPAEISKLANAIQTSLLNNFNLKITFAPEQDVSLEEGKKIYEANCKVCHGQEGNGDGPLSAQLNPKPAVLSDPKITGDDSTKPYDNFQIISVGIGGTAMLGWAETLPEMAIWNVTYYIRSFSNPNMKLPDTPVNKENDIDKVFAEIRDLLNNGISATKAGNVKQGADLVLDSYLAYENLEIGLKAKHKSLALGLESAYGRLRNNILNKVPWTQTEEVYNSIQKDLAEAESLLKGKVGFAGLFLQSISIIIREGFEAILILAALIAFLIKSRNQDKLKSIYSGALLGIAASFLTAYVLHEILNVSVTKRELMEGWIMLVSVVVLFWVSYWLISNIGAQRWNQYITQKMQSAVSKGNVLTLSMVAFLSVYREGFETVLFYKALYTYAGNDTGGIVPGFLAGSACLAVVYYLITKAGLRIPVKWFFAVTSVFLYYMAFTFMGKGLQQLQIGSVLSSTPIAFLPQIAWLGIYPTLETLAGQGVLIGAYLFAIIYTFGVKPEIKNKTLKNEAVHIKEDIAVIHDLLSHISQHAKRCETVLKDTNDHDLKELSTHLSEIDLKIQELTDHARNVENRLLDEYDRLAKTLNIEK